MLGSANQLLFGRGLAKRFYGVLEFVEKNKATNTLHINKTATPQKAKLEQLAIDTLNRVKKGILFSSNASFVTVGSDAHYPGAIGSAIIELKKKPKNEKDFLNMIKTNKTLWKGPNIYSKSPVDIIGKKEMMEGLTYLAKKNVLKKRKIPIASKISRKIRLGKRIKTIKRITKKANLKKIRRKMPKLKIKDKFNVLKKKLRILRK